MTDLLSIAAFAADQLIRPTSEFTFTYLRFSANGFLVEIDTTEEEKNVTRTAQILAEMRAENAVAIAAHNAKTADIDSDPDAKDRIRYRRSSGLGFPIQRTTSRLTESQAAVKSLILKGAEWGNDRNVSTLVTKIVARQNGQLKYASRPGRTTPDMLASLMAFFQSPSDLAHSALLANTVAGQVPASLVKSVLSDGFVIDVIEGFGMQVPTTKEMTKTLSAGVTRYGRGLGRGRPRKTVTTVNPTVVAAGGSGHSRVYSSDALPMGRIPGGNDAMHGAGFGQGAGWDTASTLTPAQVVRRNAALDGASHGFRTDADGTVIERW